jgi:hypothetical protein
MVAQRVNRRQLLRHAFSLDTSWHDSTRSHAISVREQPGASYAFETIVISAARLFSSDAVSIFTGRQDTSQTRPIQGDAGPAHTELRTAQSHARHGPRLCPAAAPVAGRARSSKGIPAGKIQKAMSRTRCPGEGAQSGRATAARFAKLEQ